VGRDGFCDVQRYDLAVARDAEHYLEQRVRTTEDRPLLMVAGLFQPHHPFVAPAELVESCRERLREAGDQASTGDLHPAIKPDPSQGPEAEQTLETRAVYAAMIEHLDGAIDQILAAAKSYLSGPTLVIYTSDHGEMAGDVGLWGKTVMLEASAGVPMIFAPLREEEPVPDLPLRAGRISSAPVSLVDIAPTLAGVAGAPALPAVDGRDLSELLRDPERENAWRERPTFSELCIRYVGGDRLAVNQPPTRLIRKGPWKLVYYHPVDRPWSEACTLHNLEEDPAEQRDLAGDPRYAKIREELLEQLLAEWDPEAISRDANERAWDMAYTRDWAAAGGSEALGYIENWSPHNSIWHYGFPGQAAERKC
jgi:choline-sulfatase